MDVGTGTHVPDAGVAVQLATMNGFLKLIDLKVDALSSTVASGAQDQNRILADHETRLRLLEDIKDLVARLTAPIEDHEKRLRIVEARLYLAIGGLSILNIIALIFGPAIRFVLEGK